MELQITNPFMHLMDHTQQVLEALPSEASDALLY